MSRNKRLSFWAILIGLAFPAACGSSGVVGGKCAADYIECDGKCVDSRNDANNCGGCKLTCPTDVACEDSLCDGRPAGNAGSAGKSGAGNGDSGASGDAGSSTGGRGGNGGGEEDDAGNLTDANPDGDAACLPPYDRPAACGDCKTQCPASAPLCTPDGAGSFNCVLLCDAPLVPCNGQCVDLNIDSENCGACGNFCPSGICQGGKCVGANFGNVMLACMNYQVPAANTAPTELIGNAAFIKRSGTVRILAYTEYVTATAKSRVDAAIGYAAQSRNRMFTVAALAKSTMATAMLNIANYDVFLVYDQTEAPAGTLASVGAAWKASSVIDSYVAAGGTVIVLSGGTSEMDEFLSNSELLDVSKQTAVTGNTLYNNAPGDALGSQVISPFLAPVDSCTFTTTTTPDMSTVFVVRDKAGGLGKPVVIHRVIEP